MAEKDDILAEHYGPNTGSTEQFLTQYNSSPAEPYNVARNAADTLKQEGGGWGFAKRIANAWAQGGAGLLGHMIKTPFYDAPKAIMEDYRPGKENEVVNQGIGEHAFNAGSTILGGAPMVEKNAVGTFGGITAKTADHAKLARAQEMQGAGAHRNQIWDETGWFQGGDGKWRFEIPDDMAEYHPGRVQYAAKEAGNSPFAPGDVGGRNFKGTLEEVLDHPELYAAYPEMRRMLWSAVPQEELGTAGGVYRGRIGSGTAGMEISNDIAPRLEAGKSVTLHEGQHHIQPGEGFPRGANPEMFKLTADQIQHGTKQAAALEDAKFLLAHAADKRMSLRDAIADVEQSYGRPVSDMAKDYAGAHAIHPEASWRDGMLKPEALVPFDQSAATIDGVLAKLNREFEQAKNPYAAYLEDEGEREARRVQNRMKMTDAERKALHPLDTPDPLLEGQSKTGADKSPPLTTEDILARNYGEKPSDGSTLYAGGNRKAAAGVAAKDILEQYGAPKPMKEYRSSWRDDPDKKPSTYNEEFFEVQPDILRDEAGKPIAQKDQLVPKREIGDEGVIAHQPDLIHRGISHEEYQDFLKTGRIQSRGGYNIGPEQEGLTYFTTQPASAVSYASSFAPSQFKPAPGRDAYVVSARRPPPDRIRQVDGTDTHEVGVQGAIPASDIAAIYRGQVIAHTPEYNTPGFKSAASSRLNWEKMDDPTFTAGGDGKAAGAVAAKDILEEQYGKGAKPVDEAQRNVQQGGMPDDYRGQHGAPDRESGSPIHDVTSNGIYPTDFYGPQGLRYYGTGDDALDASAYAKIQQFKGKPDEMVPIYRAIPAVKGKPKGVTLGKDYINPGDWVAISRQYAVDHGDSALNGNYHLVKRMVPARELYTAGDSFHEWGWDPAAAKGNPGAKILEEQYGKGAKAIPDHAPGEVRLAERYLSQIQDPKKRAIFQGVIDDYWKYNPEGAAPPPPEPRVARPPEPKQKPQPVQILDEPRGRAPAVNWRAKDLLDDGTPDSILKNYNAENVRQGYVPIDALKPKGAGIKDGRPTERGGYGWEDMSFKGGVNMPPAKVRLNKNGTVTLLDGNHRVAWWAEQGYDEVPAYIVSGNKKAAPLDKQVLDYQKEGVFLRQGDKTSQSTMPMSSFNGRDIRASQQHVDPKGVKDWAKKIQAGERPGVLLEPVEGGGYRIVDGHTRATAYNQLGIEDVPVIIRERNRRP